MGQKAYRYYAVFSYADDGITITFPDLPGCISCGYTTEEAIQMAKEAVMLYLEDLSEENMPEPTQFDHFSLKPNEKACLIEIQV